MFVIRWLVGRIILFFNFIFSPSAPKLSQEKQKALAEITSNMSLYQLPACPFCVKVRREMKRQGIVLPLKNINQDDELRQELIREGGKRTVPCLRIVNELGDVSWMYESGDIITHLRTIAV